MIHVIDNYDSFVYNLVQYAGQFGFDCTVFRNDAVTVEELAALQPELVIISPGPGGPRDAGISVELIHRLGTQVPLFGVCLGHQCIGHAFGAKIVHAAQPMHGKCSMLQHDGRGVFTGLPNPLEVTRYHSLVIDPSSLPDELEVTAWTQTGEVMGVRHRNLLIEGVQFHPESLFTAHGLQLFGNVLLSACAIGAAAPDYPPPAACTAARGTSSLLAWFAAALGTVPNQRQRTNSTMDDHRRCPQQVALPTGMAEMVDIRTGRNHLISPDAAAAGWQAAGHYLLVRATAGHAGPPPYPPMPSR